MKIRKIKYFGLFFLNMITQKLKKNVQSWNVFCVVDDQKRFIKLIGTYPGSAHDSRIHNESWMKVTDEERFDFNHPRFHIGDEGIQCQKTALSPVKENRNGQPLTRAEKLFNKTLCKFRVIVEHSFGDWKSAFPILHKVRKDNSAYSQDTITATAVLYNIQKSFEPQPPMPSQEAFENLAKFDQLMALGPDEPVPNDADNTFIRNRVIDKWFTPPV